MSAQVLATGRMNANILVLGTDVAVKCQLQEQPGVLFIDVTLEIPWPPQTPTVPCECKVRRKREKDILQYIWGERLMHLVAKAHVRKALNDFN